MRIVFLGSPDFAVPSLEALAAHYRVVGVVTQPDRPAGRGRRLRPPAVRLAAHRLGLPVVQPPRIATPEALGAIRSWTPDLIVVAAFGQLLRTSLLDLPRLGCLNVHASLLPRWRGASPVQAAILAGDATTGVTLMRMDAGLDTGPLLAQRSIPVAPDDTGGSLAARLAELGAALLLETLPGYVSGSVQPAPQDDSRSTHAPLLRKTDGALAPTDPAILLARKVRAYDPWPGTYVDCQGRRLAVIAAHAAPSSEPQPLGVAVLAGDRPAITTTDGLLVLDRVQPVGKKPMPGEAFLRGNRDFLGSTIATPA
jgi:methionyl-tRNA formyltransferase